MKLNATHHFLFLLFAFSVFGSCANRKTPIAEDGILDLKNWSFESDGNIKLDGQWEFYWNEFHSPASFSSSAPPLPQAMLAVPGLWNNTIIDGKPISGNGVASLRLVVQLPSKGDYALKITSAATSQKIFVNGNMLVCVGNPSYTEGTTKEAYTPQLVSFYTDTTRIEIVTHIANFNHWKGGPWETIWFGNKQKLENKKANTDAFEYFLLGCIFIIGIYHLGFFFLRLKDKSPLYFALFCIVITLRLLVTGERQINHLMDISWIWLIRLEYLTFYFAIPAFAWFIRSLYPHELKIWLAKLSLGIAIAFALPVLLFRPGIFTYGMIFYQIYTIVCGIYGVYLLIIASRNQRQGAFTFLLGWAVFFVTIILEILYQNGVVYTGNLSFVGLFLFIFFQAFMLSSRFSSAFIRSEELGKKVKETNQFLEDIVKKRTSKIIIQRDDIQQKNQELEKQKNELEIQTEEFRRIQKQMMLVHQRMSFKNIQVEKRKEVIEEKNRELEKHQDQLEKQALELKKIHKDISDANQEVILSNIQLEKQKEEITQQKIKIEGINKDLTASINYASRIQEALFPPKNFIKDVFPRHFILHWPKDIVSGDFYWLKQKGDWVYLAVSDCTGHGVPGAFMSLLGITFLNEIINIQDTNEENLAANILNNLRDKIKISLRQTGKKGEAQDGMDISICIINIKSKQMHYAGANNSIYILRDASKPAFGEDPLMFKIHKSSENKQIALHRIRPDKMPISIYPVEKPFTNHLLQLEDNDQVFLYTDGVVDQIGGENRKRFLQSRFIRLLMKHQDKPMKEKKAILEKALSDWMDNMEQLDDILVMGFEPVFINHSIKAKDTFNFENKQLLIVEDELEHFVFLEEILRKTKISIEWAKNGVEAVDLVTANPNGYNLILMDINMPEMNGYESIHLIREINKEVPIIIQTGLSPIEEKEKGFIAGCDNFISKPIERFELLSKIERYI